MQAAPALAKLSRSALVRTLLCMLCLLALCCTYRPATAQQQGFQAVPRVSYFQSMQPLYEGEYEDAMRGFEIAAGQGVRTADRRWIDSICYHTMAGECYYKMGRLGDALEQYNAAVQLFIVNRDWMVAVEYPAAIGPEARAPREAMGWGVPQRRTRIGNFPDRMVTPQNPLAGPRRLGDMAVINQDVLYPIVTQEIVRCTALALMRRGEIMGPACQHDPVNDQAIAALSNRPAPPNHWAQTWVNVQLGMAYAARGDWEQAENELMNSLIVGGEYDHPVTGLALLQLGKIKLAQENYAEAAVYFLEATYSAGAFGQADVVEEAFRYGMITHLASGGQGLYPPLAAAADWARREDYEALQASLLISAAENFAVLGNTDDAAASIREATQLMNRTDMPAGMLGARFQYTAALVAYQQGRVAQAGTALETAMAYQRNSSLRLFQINMVDTLFTSGGISERVAEELYTVVLREPTANDWVLDPLESLSVLLTPHPMPIERWFEVTLQRRKPELALEIADRLKRHRFYSTLPMGGRLLSLRWLVAAPETALSDSAVAQRRNLLAKFPALAATFQEIDNINTQLDRLPLANASDEDLRQRDNLVAQLAAVGAEQERMLSEIALRREPAELVFPPLQTTEDIRYALGPNSVAMVFVWTSQSLHGFMFTRDRFTNWRVDDAPQVPGLMSEMFREMRLFNGNSQIEYEQLQNESWKEPAYELLEILANDADPEFWGRYDELIIVPDGRLWYVPFEALQVGPAADNTTNLAEETRIRYAPTCGLMVPDGRGRPRAGQTAVVLGSLFPRDDPETAEQVYQDIASVLPGCVAYRDPIDAPPSALASTWSRLVVLDDVTPPRAGVYDVSPTQLTHGRNSEDLGDWMRMPFGRPDQVLLPGFHTAAEDGLRTGGNATGEEVFLSVCGIMAGGSRTVLLSRWRVGGHTAAELMREFCQELPHTTASAAWQRSVTLAQMDMVQPENEPRVRAPAVVEAAVPADHPFFWAAYMLVDTGAGEDHAEP